MANNAPNHQNTAEIFIDGQTLADFLKQTDTKERIKTATFLIETIQDSETSHGATEIDSSSITLALDSLIGDLKSWINCSNPKVASLTLDLVSLIVDVSESNERCFHIFIKDLVSLLVPRLSDKKQEIRSSIICLLNNFVLASSESQAQAIQNGHGSHGLDNEASSQNLVERILSEAQNCSKIPLVLQSVFQLLQDILKDDNVRPYLTSLARLIPFVLQQYATSSNFQTREEALECLLLIYSFTGQKMKNDILKRAKAGGYDHAKMDSLYRKLENTLILDDRGPGGANNGPVQMVANGNTSTAISSNNVATTGSKSKIIQNGSKIPFSSNLNLKNNSSSSLQSSSSSNKNDASVTGQHDRDSMLFWVV